MEWILATHPYGVFGFLLLVNLLAWINAAWLRNLADVSVHGLPEEIGGLVPSVAVLIPARDEEANLPDCLSSVLAQDYPCFHVWVLDDHSTDRTLCLAQEMASRDSRVEVVRGRELPAGWLGKHWACQQLAEASQGDFLLFLDADVRLEPAALRQAVNWMECARLDLLSVLPFQKMQSWGERLVVPFIFFATFAFVPLFLGRPLRIGAFSFTIGQFMLFRREAYSRVGGHAGVRANLADDMALGKRIIASGMRWSIMDGFKLVDCRMYHGYRQSWNGFSKNLFPAMGGRILPYVFIWAWLIIVFFEPMMVLGMQALGAPLHAIPSWFAWVCQGLVLTLWTIPYMRLHFPVSMVLLYPLVFINALGIAGRSLALAFGRGPDWKGRRFRPQALRWW